MCEEKSIYLLLWKCGLCHGIFKAVGPAGLRLLPQGFEELHRPTLNGQGLRKQTLYGHKDGDITLPLGPMLQSDRLQGTMEACFEC